MKLTVAAMGGIGALVVASYVTDARAAWFRFHGAECMAVDINVSPGFLDFLVVDSDHGVASAANKDQEFMCAPHDSSVVQRNQYKIVNVEVDSETGNAIQASLCEDNWNGWGGACGTSMSTSGVGHQTIALGSEIGVAGLWTPTSETNFGYVWVDLPAATTWSYNYLRGIWYST